MTISAVNGCGGAADHTRPGELIRLVADGLTGYGLDVRLSGPEAAAGLEITCAAGQCRLSVNDWACTELDYSPRSRDEVGPKLIADMATALLTGRADQYPRPAGARGDTYVAGKWLRRAARDPSVSPWLLLDLVAMHDAGMPGPRSRPRGDRASKGRHDEHQAVHARGTP